VRVAFLGPSYPWRGGIAQFAQNMAEKLLQDGSEIMMFTFIHQYPELFFPGSDQTDNSKVISKLPTDRILTPYNPFTWFRAVNEIRGWKPDVIIVQYWLPLMAPAFGFVLRRLKKTKKVIVLHNVESHEKWLFAKSLTSYALRKANYFITLSAISSAALLKTLPEIKTNRILQLYHPVYEPPALSVRETDAELSKQILFFGFVKYYKGLDILLKALPAVLKEIPKLKLVIAGDVYGDKMEYYKVIDEIGIKDSVEVNFRYIPDEEIGDFFTRCDVSVIPYRSATQSGVAQLSFAYEVPIIATKVGGLEEIVIDNENGFLTETENPATLAETIIRFYQCNKYSLFRENIKKQNMNFSWHSFIEKVTVFIK
jgi:D-inositol-3-phosphate glycosyltransferase